MTKKTSNKEETEKVFAETVCTQSDLSSSVQDNWNQITLSLASNGGYTVYQGRKLILYVFIQEKINGKAIYVVKSFVVTKKELESLQSEAQEFSSEIEAMITAKSEEDSLVIKSTQDSKDSKDLKKKDKDEIKKAGKALTEVLKKGLNSVKKKKPDVQYPDSDDYESPDDSDREYDP